MLVYNASTWMEKAVEQLVGYADRIAIVEGGVDATIRSGGKQHSTDGTLEIMQELEAKYSAVECHSGDFSSKTPMRQKTVEMLSGCDYLHVVDSDEFYMRGALRSIRGKLNGRAYRIPFVHFHGGFDRRLTGEKWDTLPGRIYAIDGLKYTAHHAQPDWISNQDCKDLDIQCFHCGWFDTPQKINEKLAFYRLRDAGISKVVTVKYDGPIPEVLQNAYIQGLISPPEEASCE